MSSPLATIVTDDVDSLRVVRLRGEIDMSNAEELEPQLLAAIGDAREVAFDLTDISYLDSQGLHLIQRMAVSLGADDITFSIVARPEGIAGHLLALTHMDQQFTVVPTLSSIHHSA